MLDTATEVNRQGKVKWFSKEKGYGFISDEQDQDFYFSVNNVKGQELPTIGTTVSFYPHQNEKGHRAKSVNIQQLSNDTNSYATCSGCKKKMIPRIVFSEGRIDHSICPFCATWYKNFIKPWKRVLFFFLDILIPGR